jgi:short-subunit dehydrogenase
MLKGKNVWVTGASSGIGEALSVALANEGANLVLSGRNEERLIQTSEKCEQLGVHKFVLPLDLTDHSSFKPKVQKAIMEFRHIDILINNAGISQRATALDSSIEVERTMMEVNYFGTIWLTKAILPDMLQRSSGRIVVVTSMAGKFGTKYRSAYAASKHALHGYFDALSMELSDTGVDINIICPGFVQTSISMNALVGDGSRQNKMDQATEKGITAEVCAKQIIRAIKKNNRETFVGREGWAMLVKRLSPNLFYKILSRSKVT